MRFMIIRLASEGIEADRPVGREFAAKRRVYDETLVKAGVLLTTGTLHRKSREARIAYRDGKAVVIDRPFIETEWIAGFWLIQARDREEAIEWARRVPVPTRRGDDRIDVWQCAGLQI